MNEKTEKIKKIRNLLLAGGCIITAIICRHLPANRESGWLAFFQLTRAYLYITLYCVWGISLQRRIVNRTARRCLCGIASLMVFWFVIRTLKYNVFYEPVLRRYSWYGYYVPLLAIPSLSVIAALKMRESENQKRRQWTGIFLVITVGVILLVMTNDLHQLVFRFPAEKPWSGICALCGMDRYRFSYYAGHINRKMQKPREKENMASFCAIRTVFYLVHCQYFPYPTSEDHCGRYGGGLLPFDRRSF